MARKSTTTLLLQQLGLLLLVLASLPSPSQQSQAFFENWLGENSMQYGTPTMDTPSIAADVVTANATAIYMGIDPAGGDGKHRTIADALAVVPDVNNTKRYVFSLKPGHVFREKVVVGKSKRYVTFKSDPANPAVVVWNDTAATPGKDGEPLAVVGSATVTIEAANFIANGVVFKNDGPIGGKQGASFFNCTIEDGQGVLYDEMGTHYFKNCTINSGVDTIFSFGRSFYDDCRVISKQNPGDAAVATARTMERPRSHTKQINSTWNGFAFHNCIIEAGGANDKVYLGRAWEDSSFVVYTYSKIANEIVPIGYDDHGSIQKPPQGSGVYYGVYNCSGPGLDASKKMGWAKELADGDVPYAYSYYAFVDGESWVVPRPADHLEIHM
uniref:pectinesterase n=1 Tax=Oryza punctata TaxID=4537 RepID=A0A0E0MHV9_ORYPU